MAARLDASLVADGDGGRVTAKILRMDALEREGFGGLVAVGAAAARDGREPALVHLKFTPGGSPSANVPRRKVAFVGKGVTLDTGGLQIKPRTGMGGMKTDLGRRGRVGRVRRHRRSPPDAPRRASPGALRGGKRRRPSAAFRPDDAAVGKSGKTMEINNTDAEGRLVLADGVAFASGELACDDIIDVATLTGAQMVATGRYFVRVVSDDEEFETGRKSQAVGRAATCATRCRTRPSSSPESFTAAWRTCEIQSRTDPTRRRAARGSSSRTTSTRRGDATEKRTTATQGSRVLKESKATSDEARRLARRWLHVDMAGPSTHAGSGRGTGFGVALLAELVNGPAFAPEPR